MSFLTSITNNDIILYLIIAFIVLVILLIVWIIRLEVRVKRLMRGKSGFSLENSFTDMQKDIDTFIKFRGELEKYLKTIEKRVSKSIQGVHNFNFNAFKGMESGGKSFATAFLNENGDGIVLSSLHARDRVSIFAKQIKNFKPEMELSEEENLALTKAREYCNL
jgi:hypothetical protein